MTDTDNTPTTLSKDTLSLLKSKDYAGLQEAVKNDPSLAKASEPRNGYTLLCLIADDDNVPEKDMMDLVSLLLSNGADLTAQSKDGAKNTALHLALAARNIYFLRAMKAAAPDKMALFSTTTNGNGETALQAFAKVNPELDDMINLIELMILVKG
tara:strand:+ start:161 stop:625 length:465 start_codon:yes stop_codon:yes gene_type:complete